jgi:hypothetical protein
MHQKYDILPDKVQELEVVVTQCSQKGAMRLLSKTKRR